MSASSYVIATFLICLSLSTHATKDLLDVIPTMNYLGKDAWSVVALYLGYDDLPASLFPLSAPLISSFQHATDSITSALDFNGSYIITAAQDDNKACLWNASTGNLMQSFLHTSYVDYACLDHTNTYLFTTSDNNGYVWDIASSKKMHTLSHTGQINVGYFSKDSQRIITASDDTTACIWDTLTGKKLHTLVHPRSVKSAEFSIEGNRAITYHDRCVHVWDVITGKKLFTLEQPEPDFVEIRAAFFNNDATQIAVAIAGSVYLWNTKTQKFEHILRHSDPLDPSKNFGINSINYANTNALIVTAGADHYVRIWDSTTGKEIRNIHYDYPTDFTSLRAHFSPQDNYIVITICNGQGADIWDLHSGVVLYRTRFQIDPSSFHNLTIYARCNAQEMLWTTICRNGKVCVWDISLAKALAVSRLSARQFILLHLLDKEFSRSQAVSLTALATQEDVTLKQVQDTFAQFDEKTRAFLTIRYTITA